MIFVKGFLGWGNRKNGVEAYGPGGRWGGRDQDGDLLGDALAREGDSEGSTLFVVSVSRSEIIADRTIEQRVEAAIRDALAWLNGTGAPEQGDDR